MRVIHKQAEQGHAYPSTVMGGNGPFGKYEPVKATEEYATDPYPPGATAQNGMAEVLFYECNSCGGTVREYDLDAHECKE